MSKLSDYLQGATIFLSEWNSGATHSLWDWYLHDRITSVRWWALGDRVTMSLYENTDGTGSGFGNIKGWGSSKEVSNLGDFGFNDVFSAFSWTGIVPIKEIIAPIHLTLDGSRGVQGLTAAHHETNDSAVDQTFELSLGKEDTTEVTTSTTDQHVAGITATFT